MVASASVTVDATHADGQVDFNITAFDLAGNNVTVNQTNLTSSNLTMQKHTYRVKSACTVKMFASLQYCLIQSCLLSY